MLRLLSIIVFIQLFFTLSYSHNRIKGLVKDEHNQAIAFASIYDAFGHGTMADSLGYFELYLPDSDTTTQLYVSALGYITDTLNIERPTAFVKLQLKQDTLTINEVQITHQQSIKEMSMVSAFSTNKQEIALLNPQNIAEVLQTQTAFTNRTGYQSPLNLRGMSGKHLLVLRNGMRRFSSYPSGYMSHTINVYDLERIDVEKGAASVRYGAGAIGGIINLVDKSPFKQAGFNARLTGGYGSVNAEKNLLLCGGWSNGRLAFKSAFRHRDADCFTYADGSLAENSFYTDKDWFFSAGYAFSPSHQIILTADIHDGGPWGKPVGFNGSDYMRVKTKEERADNISLQYKTSFRERLSLEWSTFYANESRILEKNYYTAAGYMLSYVETTNFSDYYYGSRIQADWEASSFYHLSTGAEVYSFHISTPTDAVDYIEGISFQNRVSHNARSYTYGQFIENELKFSQDWRLIAGLRYDYATIYEGDVYSISQEEEQKQNKEALSGHVATAYAFSTRTKLKLNIAHAFRMPESNELYADSYTSNGILYANAELEPEYCNSIDLVLSHNTKAFNLEFSPFLWLMKGMITKEEIKGMPGTNYQYVNIGKSRLWGGEIELNGQFTNLLKTGDQLKVAAGIAYVNGSELSSTEDYWDPGTPLDYIPPLNAKSRISYDGTLNKKTKLTFALRSIFYTEQKRLGDSSYATPSYLIFGTSLGFHFTQIKTQPSINLAINNLFNSNYYAYNAYLPSAGRDIRLFLTFHIN